jgi:hypothetical protein
VPGANTAIGRLLRLAGLHRTPTSRPCMHQRTFAVDFDGTDHAIPDSEAGGVHHPVLRAAVVISVQPRDWATHGLQDWPKRTCSC